MRVPMGLSLAVVAASGMTASAQTFLYTGAPIPIPDGVDPTLCATNPGAEAVAPITVPVNVTITDINVAWFVPHTWQGDLKISLRHNGTSVLLVDRAGSDGVVCGFSNDNYGLNAGTLFQSIAGAPFTYDLNNPGAPADSVVGPWLPENPYTPFIGTSSAGTWELVIQDCAGADTGEIVAVALTIAGSGGGGGCYPNCDASTIQPCLNVQDFGCFINKFSTGDTYANCDSSTVDPILNVQDFGCFLNKFSIGCSGC